MTKRVEVVIIRRDQRPPSVRPPVTVPGRWDEEVAKFERAQELDRHLQWCDEHPPDTWENCPD